MRRHRVVRVPASSANLGPGYDSLAAALSPTLELTVEETGTFGVECDVRGVPCDRTNLCVQAFEKLHPADGPPPGVAMPATSITPAIGSSQNDSAFSRGNAMSAAPSISGIT